MSDDRVVRVDNAEIAGVEADSCCFIIGVIRKDIFPIAYCRTIFGYLGEVCSNFFLSYAESRSELIVDVVNMSCPKKFAKRKKNDCVEVASGDGNALEGGVCEFDTF